MSIKSSEVMARMFACKSKEEAYILNDEICQSTYQESFKEEPTLSYNDWLLASAEGVRCFCGIYFMTEQAEEKDCARVHDYFTDYDKYVESFGKVMVN